jgi:hypothetical protein
MKYTHTEYLKKNYITLKIITMFVLLAALCPRENYSQVINKFGIKGGLIISKLTLSENVSDAFSYEPEREYKFLSMDVGIYAEMFDSRFFCISTELHYNIKGEEAYQDFEILQPNTQADGFEYRKVSDRFHYVSLQILPRWKYLVNTQDKLYLFGGPRIDLRVANSKSGGKEDIKLSNNVIEPGFTVGIGNEIWDLLTIELRYEMNFTSVYKVSYGNTSVSRKNNSFTLLAGLSLKKLLRVHF